jgi:hypothetical protein
VYAPSTDILAAGAAEPGRRAASWWLVGGVGLLVLVLIGGVTAGLRFLSGGGVQPEQALASGAFAFGKVDLDPPAGQKVNALRFLRTFPGLKDRIGPGADLREVVFEQVTRSSGLAGVDFGRDVAPWLGERAALAAYPAAGDAGSPEQPGRPGTADVVVALQVTDPGAAEDGLQRLVSASGTPTGFVVGPEYAVLAETQQLAERAAAVAGRDSLSDDPDLSADLDALGDGVAAFWADLGRAGESALAGLSGLGGAPGLGPRLLSGTPGTAPSGRLAYVLRFDGGNALELVGRAHGGAATVPGTAPVTGVQSLPDSTVAALGATGLGAYATGVFDGLRASLGPQQYRSAMAQAERALGLSLPGDLSVLLGTELVLALDGGPSAAASGAPPLGAVVTTDPVAAERVLRRLDAAAARNGQPVPLVHRTTDAGYVVALDEAQRDRLTGDGGLGGVDGFRDALPDLDGARLVLFVDVPGTMRAVSGAVPTHPDLAALRSVGLTVSAAQQGAVSFRLRVLAG